MLTRVGSSDNIDIDVMRAKLADRLATFVDHKQLELLAQSNNLGVDLQDEDDEVVSGKYDEIRNMY